jgi:hypothetical protein
MIELTTLPPSVSRLSRQCGPPRSVTGIAFVSYMTNELTTGLSMRYVNMMNFFRFVPWCLCMSCFHCTYFGRSSLLGIFCSFEVRSANKLSWKPAFRKNPVGKRPLFLQRMLEQLECCSRGRYLSSVTSLSWLISLFPPFGVEWTRVQYYWGYY